MDGGGAGGAVWFCAAAKNDAIKGKAARRRTMEVIDAGKCIRLGVRRKAAEGQQQKSRLLRLDPDIAAPARCIV
jgi:hypothetical protein